MGDKDEIRLQVLSDHYNHTFDLIKEDVARRTKLFLYILVLISVISFQLISPDVGSDVLNSFVNTQIEAAVNIDITFVEVILWFGLLSLVHTYFQVVLHVERQYKYLYKLEDALSSYYGNKLFIREGRHYKKYQSPLSSWTKLIYWWIFPVLLILFVFGYIIVNISRFSISQWPYLSINILISLGIMMSSILYLLALHRKIEKKAAKK